MGYSNTILITNMLAQALTSSTPSTLNTLAPLISIGNTLDTNNVTPAVINSFIATADSEINNALSVLYVTPLKMLGDLELYLSSSATATSTSIIVSNASNLQIGDLLAITDGINRDNAIVSSISGNTVTLAAAIANSYLSGARVVRTNFPDPIPYTSARKVCAYLYNKLFAAQTEKNDTEYGKSMRKLANIDLQNILSGTTVLKGQIRIGRLTGNPNLIKEYGMLNEKPFKFPGSEGQ